MEMGILMLINGGDMYKKKISSCVICNVFFIIISITSCAGFLNKNDIRNNIKKYENFKQYLFKRGYSEVNFDPEFMQDAIYQLVYGDKYNKNSRYVIDDIYIDDLISVNTVYITDTFYNSCGPNFFTWCLFNDGKKMHYFIKINYMMEYTDIFKTSYFNEKFKFHRRMNLKVFY